MAKTIVLVDFRWVLYRSSFKFNEFKIEENEAEIYTGAVYGVLEFAKTVLSNYDKVDIFFCLDGHPVEREKLLPSYKEKRHEADPVPEIASARALHDEPIKILSTIPNVHFIQDAEKEADDLMAMIAFRELGKGNKPIIFTGDKDLLQLMQFGIKISKNIEEGKLQLLPENYITLHKDFQCAPEELLYLRALNGDKSDEIPAAFFKGGSTPLRLEFAKLWHQSGDRYLEHFDDLVEKMDPIIETLFKGKKAQDSNKQKIRTIKEDAIRNIKLMELDKYEPIAEAYKAYKETKNKESIEKIKEKFNFSNIKSLNYDLDGDDIKGILDRLDLQRFKAWMNYNNYI